MTWSALRRVSALAAFALVGSQLPGCTSSGGPDRSSEGAAASRTGVEEPAGVPDPPAAPPLPPDIQVSPNPLACRSSSLAGQHLAGQAYPVLTQPGGVTQVDWSVDGQALGSAAAAPFVPRDGSGRPVALPLAGLSPGRHEVVARLQGPDGSTSDLVGTFTTDDLRTPAVPATITVTPTGGDPEPLDDWTLLEGRVTFGTSTGPVAGGQTLGFEIDGRRAPATIHTASLPPGRHRLTVRGPSPNGSAVRATRTFVTTGDQPTPEPCGTVEVRDHGAAGDGRTDDSDAVRAATEVAMAAGATVHFSAGTYAIPTLENVALSREVAFEGDGAVLDGGRAGERYDLFQVDASVSFSGLAVRNAGRVFTFDGLHHRVDRFVIERSTFTDVYSPAHVSDAPDEVVERIVLGGNTVERAVKGFYLPLRAVEHARVTANRLTDVGDAAIRLGSDRDPWFSSQRDIDVRANEIRNVTGESDANGIKVLGVGAVIVGNDVRGVASSDGTDSEGIYTKGNGHLIAGNHLLDAGRTQAQITVKSDGTTVADNVIVTDRAQTNGIRIEGSDVVVEGNRLQGGLPESIGISTKLTQGFGGYVIEENTIEDTDGVGIVVGGDGSVTIRRNRFSDLRGEMAVSVRATRADTTDVDASDNEFGPMPSDGSHAFDLEARGGRTLSAVRIAGNSVTGVAYGVVFRVAEDGSISHVVATGNTWTVGRDAYRNQAAVAGFTPR